MDGAASPLPRALLGWLPYLWSRVLFPGPSTALQARRASEANTQARSASEGHVPIPRSRFGLVSKALLPLIVLPGLSLFPSPVFG